MSIENKELLRAWEILFTDFIESGDNHTTVTTFKVTFPDGKIKDVKVIFKRAFVDDYLHIEGGQDRSKILKQKKGLFKTWGLTKIKESIDKNSLQEDVFEITDFKKDSGWAEKIEKRYLQQSKRQQDINTYYYTPKRKIGFK